MNKIEQIKNLLVHDDREETRKLYLKIPFFTRTQLSSVIDSVDDWRAVSDGCERGIPTYLEEASGRYSTLMGQINLYIESNKRTGAHGDRLFFMISDRNFLQANFAHDPAGFVREMATCLEQENFLLRSHQYSASYSTNTNEVNIRYSHDDGLAAHAGDVNLGLEQFQPEDQQLRQIEELAARIERSILGEAGQASSFTQGPSYLNDTWTDSNQYQNMSTDHQMTSLDMICQIVEAMQEYLKVLEKEVTEWKRAEAKFSVGIGPECSFDLLSTKFGVYAHVMDALETSYLPHLFQYTTAGPSLTLNHAHEKFRKMKEFFFKITLLVTVQPKDVISIENEKTEAAKQRKVKQGEEKNVKRTRSYCTKKNQRFDTTLRLLGGERFSLLTITKSHIQLYAEKDLAARLSGAGGTEAKTNLDFRTEVSRESDSYLLKFQEVGVNNFVRVEQNNVYKQFFRLRYSLTVSCNNDVYELQTLSLPFMFNTGSNQLLELIGAKMLYCANSPDMYSGSFTCPDPIDVGAIIQMLDDRVRYIDKRGRKLTEEEKKFLVDRLPSKSTDGKVSMQGFIKDKMKKSRNTEELPFSFHTWFHAVMYSLSKHLLQPWLDGAIYGFCSEKTAEKLLMNPLVAVGTIILRPSISSQVKNMSSKEATAALTMDIKMEGEPNEATHKVISVPLMIKAIQKNTLYGAIAGIQKNKRSIAKYLYTASKQSVGISALKKYGGDPQIRTFEDYKIMVEKLETFNLKSSEADPHSCDGVGTSPLESGPRKRQHREEACNVPDFDLLAPSTDQAPIKSEFILEPQSNVWPSAQGQRSGHQSNSLPGTYGVNASQGLATTSQGIRCMGGVLVDLSHIQQVNSHLANVHHNLAAEQFYNQFDGPASSLSAGSLVTPDTNCLPEEQMAQLFEQLSQEQQVDLLESTAQNFNIFGVSNENQAQPFFLGGHQHLFNLSSQPETFLPSSFNLSSQPETFLPSSFNLSSQPETFLASGEEDMFSTNELSPTDSGVFVGTPSPDLSPQSHPLS
ncbi:signal transducer and activator of transcription 1-like [Physella acuta]|uniref:signal transducer and activator of transcription 1-like n=1 Tax=Physella acuta TaxID=109671 RepID=UPI0027DBD978|nr:signal transducer and activator of transcription 1-like [Physella acuta]